MAGYLGAIPVPQATQHRESFTATSGQTTFNTAGYTVGFLDVYLNGSHLSPADFTATNGSDVVLASGASTGDVCDIISYTAFEVADQTFTGTTTLTGDLALGDNDKAIFGAGSDLQVYHDGSASVISDEGSGNLLFQTNGTSIKLNKGTSENMLVANVDGSVDLYYDDAKKLATTSTGIDVTGTVTSDGLTSTGSGANTTYFTGGDNSVAGRQLTLSSEASGGQNNATHRLSVPSGYGSFNVSVGGSERLKINNNGDLSLYEDTGTTAKFFWDASAESLGIGTSSPSKKLEVSDTTNQDVVVRVTNNDGNAEIQKYQDDLYLNLNDTGNIIVRSGSTITERMRIDSSGSFQLSPASNQGTFRFGNQQGDGSGIGAQFYLDSSQSIWYNSTTSTADKYHAQFINGNGLVGHIKTNGSATAYNTSSDYRLKTDAQPMTGASARVLALKPVNFEWIADGTRVDGFLAHEAQAVVPEAVTGTKDAMMDEEYQVSAAKGDIYTAGSEAYVDEDGNDVDAVDEVIHSADAEQPETLEDGKQWRETTPAVMGTRSVPDMQGIDQSKLVPLLVASLQEALARITALENA